MKAMRYIVILFVLLVFCGCGGTPTKNEGVKLSERESYRYDKVLQEVEQVELMYEQVATSPSQEAIVALLTKAQALKYDYNDEGMNVATMQHCDSLKMRIMSCQERAVQVAEGAMLQSGEINLVKVQEQLFTERTYYPVYLKKDEKLYCKIESSSALTAKLYNADTERLIKSYQKNKISDSITIANTGIYLLEVVPQGKLYASVSLGFRPTESSDIYNRPAICTEQVECKKGDLGAVGVPGVVMRKCFEEPRKFTLRGQIKAAFSGNAKALVAVQVPEGTTDILYSMRIATSESSRSEDGKFHDNLTRSYKRIKFLGLPLYEKATSNGLLNTLLDDNRPVREEDAYCNMYLFRNQSQAKQFQDGTKAASLLNYDVDYSTVGTQSCNGRIPTKGAKTIYLAFENERMRYTNYLWVEVEAVVPNTVYYRTKYSVN
ncbi:MAG: hypothetical protein J6J77_04075 [Alistipes sp.]|nr:hypothetical protein [Alistipes sp.]